MQAGIGETDGILPSRDLKSGWVNALLQQGLPELLCGTHGYPGAQFPHLKWYLRQARFH